MKKILIVFASIAFISCGNKTNKNNTSQEKAQEEVKTMEMENSKKAQKYASFGKKITPKKAISADAMLGKYKNLKPGDTLQVKFVADVVSVCKKKGCWMNLGLPGEEESMVKFKDYAFFVPKNIEEKEVIVQGKAYITMLSVEKQRHYAKDGGKSEAEIQKITEPKRTLSFIADGVLIKQ